LADALFLDIPYPPVNPRQLVGDVFGAIEFFPAALEVANYREEMPLEGQQARIG